MNRLTFYCLLLVMGLIAVSWEANAEDSETGLHILHPSIHADRDRAEVCLEADHPLDSKNHARLVAAVHLESEGKTQAIAPQNIIVDANSFCVLGLEHRRDYTLSLTSLRGEKGEKLSEIYTTSFVVPDRHASLTFIGNAADNGLIQWRHDDPILRTVNIDHVHIELYHVTDVAALGDAWRQRLQTTLAPSESTYFAQHNGTLVWQQDIEVDAAPNAKFEQSISLNKSQPLAPSGLYLLVASAPQALDKTKKLSLAPLAAVWLLRSDLNMHTVNAGNGAYILTERDNGSAVAADVHIVLQDRNQKILAETKSNAEGIAFVSLPPMAYGDKATLIGLSSQGDAAFSDLSPSASKPYVLSDSDASLVTDKAFYEPQAPINSVLTARDVQGRALSVQDSFVQVLRPDHSVFTTLPVPMTENGVAHLTFYAPADEGDWSLSWLRSDGTILAQTPLRLTSNAEAPSFSVTADHAMISDDDAVNLTIKSTTYKGHPAPYLAGHLVVTWIVPDKIFPEFSDYTFGVHDYTSGQPVSLASFITDEKGVVHLPINLNPPTHRSPLLAAQLTVIGDVATGAAPASPLILPMRPQDFIVGIKTDIQDNRFPENSLAHFMLVAVDANGRRRSVDDLSYQISEEGRHFDWYPTEGRWDYKPLRQERRLGGAPLTLSTQDNMIEWPVSAGNYRLDVTDADGAVLARLPFSAGWGVMPKSQVGLGKLALVLSKDGFQYGHPTTLHFVLPEASVITAIIADDRVRQVVHGLRPKGNNTLEILPQQDWGKHISVSLSTSAGVLSGQALLTSQGEQNAEKNLAKGGQANTAKTLAVTAELPEALERDDVLKTTAVLKNNTVNAETYHYTLLVSPGLALAGVAQGSVHLASGQQKTIPFSLRALQPGLQSVHLDITETQNNHINQSWDISISDASPWLMSGQTQQIEPQKTETISSPDKKDRTDLSTFAISRERSENLPEILSSFLYADPFTTRDIALWLETFNRWHQIIVQMNLLSEQAFHIRQQDVLARLLARQSMDGGFPLLPQHESDLASTAAALYALKEVDAPAAKLALDQSSNWLHHALENGWFDESERPLRAEAYAALAVAGHVDVPSLYYFSDNTKTLPALAAAQLAQAFNAVDDRAKAHFWLQSIPPKARDEKNLPLLAALASNPLTSTSDYSDLLQKAAPAITGTQTPALENVTAFLRTLASINERAGLWRAIINGSDKTFHDLQVIAMTDASVLVHNMTDVPLHVLSIYEASSKTTTTPIGRHLYYPNGVSVSEGHSFDHSGMYVMVLEGAWPKEAKAPIVINDEPSMALSPASCALTGGVETDDTLAWIRQQSLSHVSLCEKSAHGIHVMLDPSSHSENTWRVAYLVKAEWAGVFNLSPAHILP